ncbi:hypothetical protein TNCV_330161 [Trichonephila clavipes]|nr:hypothetical protein TNCV_330161 [Trichonephila clavipes]
MFQLLGVSRGMVSKVMTAYTQHSKTSSAKQNSGCSRSRTFTDDSLNQHLDSPVSMITVKRHLQKQNIYGRAAIPKTLAIDVNVKRRLQ